MFTNKIERTNHILKIISEKEGRVVFVQLLDLTRISQVNLHIGGDPVIRGTRITGVCDQQRFRIDDLSRNEALEVFEIIEEVLNSRAGASLSRNK